MNALGTDEHVSKPSPLRENQRRRPLEGVKSSTAIVTFVAMAFIWSWGIGYLAARMGGGLNTVLMISAGFGPSLAGLAVMHMFGTSAGRRRWNSRSLNWRLRWGWFALAFVLPPTIMLAAILVHVVLGGAYPAYVGTDHIPLVILNFVLVLMVGGPLGEEFGWRGFMTPALRSRMGWRPASVIIGLVWGAWHLPLFFLAGTPQSSMPVAVFMLNILAGAVVFGWLYERTRGSVLPAIVLHTSLNGWAGVLGIVPTAESGLLYVLVTGLLVLVALAFLATPDKATAERGRAASKRSSAC
jgi:uncharacterized protein